MSLSDFEETIKKVHLALKEFYRGNPNSYNLIYSTADDASLLGAQGGISIGSKDVTQHLTTRASWFQAGRNISWDRLVEFSTQDLGYIVEIERFDATMEGTNENVHIDLRATTIFRRENGEWKIIHRIADPLVSRISPETYRSLAKHNTETRQKVTTIAEPN